MARATLPLTQSTRDGVVVTETTGDATNGHVCTNDGKVLILAHNTGASSRTITFITPGTVDGQAVADRTATVATDVSKVFGPFPTADYGASLAIDVSHAELHLVAIH
jgi:hypothetical protein